MNTENRDLHQFRNAWYATGEAIKIKENNDTPQNPNERQTALERLRTKYISRAIANIIGAPFMFCLIYFVMYSLRSQNLEFRLSLSVSSALLLVGAAMFYFHIWKGLGKIKLLTMPVKQVASLALKYKKRELQGLGIGYPIAILWIIFFIYATGQDWFPPVIGGISGLWFGIKAIRKMMNDFDQLAE